MDVKLIFSDIDGTLLNKNREISTETKSAVNRLSHLPFILISSRMPSAINHLQKVLNIEDLPIIAYNGGLILDANTVLESTEISFEITQEIVKINQNKTHLSLYHHNNWFVPELDYWSKREINNTKVQPKVQSYAESLSFLENNNFGTHKIMCMGEEINIDNLYNSLSKRFSNQIHLYRSKPTYIEIAPKQISKLSAIKLLINQNFSNLSIKQCLAFGDNYNDIEMLNGVGYSVAVNNAKPEVKKIAQHITLDAKQHGVAHFLNNYIN